MCPDFHWYAYVKQIGKSIQIAWAALWISRPLKTNSFVLSLLSSEMETVRESPLGQLLRWITGNRIFLYSEERTGFSLDSKQIKWKTALSRNGTDCLSGNRASRSSEVLPSSTAHARLHPPRSQEMVENLIVDWYGPQDPSNPRNWSSSKKKRAAFIIWCGLIHSLFVQWTSLWHNHHLAYIHLLCIVDHPSTCRLKGEVPIIGAFYRSYNHTSI